MKKCMMCMSAILLLTFYSLIAQDRPISSEDFYQIKNITDFQISPDGKIIAYVLQSVDRENDRYSSTIWLIPKAGGISKQLTMTQAQDHSPCWSPDSRYLAFVSNRSGKNQIWLISVQGGEAWALTDLPTGATAPAWSPDAKHIAFLSRVKSSEKDSINKGIRYIERFGKEYATDVKIINNLKYRSGTSYFDWRFSHIFIVSVDGKNPEQLTFGDFHDAAPVWSPKGDYIAFSSNRNGDIHFDDNTDIYLLSPKNRTLIQLTSGAGPESDPAWSPDGKSICFIGKTNRNDYAQQTELWTINVINHTIKNLTASFDRDPTKPQWSLRDKKIYFLAADRGDIHLFSCNQRSGTIEKVIAGERQLSSFQVTATDNIIFLATHNTNPGDLCLGVNNEKRLTFINQSFLNSIMLSEPEDFYFNGYTNTPIHGWIMRPIHFSAEKKYPLILYIHGGPHWYFGNSWFQEFQILAAQGYVIFYCNPRLSTGYGQSLARAGVGEWGIGDYEDLMRGIDYVLKTYDFIDSTRMGVTGGSYGGFMTSWIIGHTDRFKAAITQRSIANLVSFYSTTDIQNFIEFQFGLPWENFEKLYHHSPITYAGQINTPLLIIHSELDYRVPISQAEELFTYLKRRNVDVEFIRYPDEGHELSRSGKPLHRVDRYNRIIVWFNKYLK